MDLGLLQLDLPRQVDGYPWEGRGGRLDGGGGGVGEAAVGGEEAGETVVGRDGKLIN